MPSTQNLLDDAANLAKAQYGEDAVVKNTYREDGTDEYYVVSVEVAGELVTVRTAETLPRAAQRMIDALQRRP